MEITKTEHAEKVVLSVAGKIDTNTCMEFESVLMAAFGGSANIVVDLEKVDYISSAGLRVFLKGEKKSRELGGSIALSNASENVFEVLEMTGFSDILTVL